MKARILNLIVISVLLLAGSSVYSQQMPDGDCISEEEMELYNLLNQYRKSKGLQPVPLSASMQKVARYHAWDLSENQPAKGKCNMHSWSKKGNWSSCCYTPDHKKAECMWNKPKEISGYEGHGFEISSFSTHMSPKQALENWKKSKSHNEVMINKGMWKKIEWNAVGIGIYGNYAVIWFGREKDDKTPKSCKQ